MKYMSRRKSILGIVGFSLLLIIGTLLAFVPIRFGSKDYNSFFGSIATSNELGQGITATYEIKGNPSQAEIDKSTIYMKKFLVDEGYPTASVFKVGDNKIVVEVSRPKVDSQVPDTEQLLKTLGGGQIVVSTASSFDNIESDGVVTLYAHKHFDEVKTQTYNTISGIVVEFNKEGKNLYQSTTGKSLYIYQNGEPFPNSSNNTIDGRTDSTVTNITLWFNSFESAEYYDLVFRSGMLAIGFDTESILINSAEPSATIFGENCFDTNYTLLACLLFLLAVVIACVVYSIIKYRAFGVISSISFVFVFYIALFLFQAMNWVEISVSSMIVIAVMILLNFFFNNLFFDRVRSEFALGKSLETSIDSGYKKSLPIVLELSIIGFLIGVLIAVIGHDSFASIGSIIAIGSVVNLIGTLGLVKLFTNIYYSFNSTDEKKYALKREGK